MAVPASAGDHFLDEEGVDRPKRDVTAEKRLRTLARPL
jgi:hypothetical protein